ncbi:MAG: ferrous iron transport protein A [Flavobacteriaceae bacterium]|nr:ferrous iron transport protein A [Flavobacteriaceae bacterium]
MRTLETLNVGEKAVVELYTDNSLPLKLIEMGCTPGSMIEIIKKASFNDPLYICVDNNYLAIRKDLASKISVSD